VRLVWAVIPLVLFGIIGIQESFAQEMGMCAPLVYEEIVENAGAMFTGTVVSKEPLSEYTNNVQFEIDELLLGDYKNTINVTTSESRMVSSEPFGGDPFEVGEKYFVIATNNLYADSSGCTYSLIIPILSGYYGMESSQNCSAKVHSQCLERCRIGEFRWGGDWVCLQTCYAENANQCNLKPELKIDLHLSPLKQIASGTLPKNVTCTEDLELIFKSTDDSPACVKFKTTEKLIQRGWASNEESRSKFNPRDIEVMDR